MAMLRAITKYGVVEGIPGFNQAVTVFRGIPYAAPPVGELRWKAPQPLEPWEGIRQCYNYGNISYQARRPSEGGGTLIGDEFYCVDWPRSEDCLYLNVWTPAKTGDEKLPVAVYLHGGGYAQGYGHLNCYDGEGFNKRGLIMVSLNHRLGIFGYLAHPELDAENERGVSGNYGVLDMIAAFHWIKENIEAFGGDPDRISIFGQSGGGDKVKTMLLSPLAKGLVDGAIMQSGGGLNRIREELPMAEAEQRGAAILERMGYHSIAEARQATQEELMDNVLALGNPMGLPFAPCIDGYVFPKATSELILNGEYPDIPVMIGCTAEDFVDESDISSYVLPSRDEAWKTGESMFGQGYGDTFLKAIHYDEDPAYAAQMFRKYVRMTGATLAGDIAFAEAQIRNGKKPAYQYFLTLVPPSATTAHHSAEHQYVFQTLTKSKRPYTGRDWDLSNQLADYWANFLKNGDPNGDSFTGGSLPVWNPYTEAQKQAMEINYDLKMIDEQTNDLIDFMIRYDLKQE